jgi:hypothetical protein
MQRCPCSVKRMGATWGISDNLYHIFIMLFCRYANHICISHTARTNYGDECDLPLTMHTPSIFGKSFVFVRNVYGRYIIMILHMHVHK